MKGAWVLQDEHYLATVLHPKLKHLQMGAPGDREKAVRLLNLAIEKQTTSHAVSSSGLSRQRHETSSTDHSTGDRSHTPEKKNLLARCFDQASGPISLLEHECDEYLKSVVVMDGKTDDDGDSEWYCTGLSLRVDHMFNIHTYVFIFKF